MSSRKHALADALEHARLGGGEPGEERPYLQLTTGFVTARNTGVDPYLFTVRYADGTTQAGLTCVGAAVPRVDELVHVLIAGPTRLILGPNLPAVVENIAPAAPPVPPAAPAAPPSVRSVPITPTGMASWDSRNNRWRTDGMYQGGGWMQRAFWFYGAKIAAAKGSGTIVAAKVYVERENSSHGVAGSQQANVRLGTHGYGSQPSNGNAPHANVARIGGLVRGQHAALWLTPAQVASLNAGAVGLGLEPGSLGYASTDYLVATYGGASGHMMLTING